MTQEEARIRLAVAPPRLEERFWTVAAVYDGGGCAFVPNDASLRMAADRYVVERPNTLTLLYHSKERAEKAASEWTRLAEKENLGVAFVAVEARRTLKCAD